MNTLDPQPDPTPDPDDELPNESWFARNVLWVIPVVFLIPMSCFMLVCGGPVFYLLSQAQDHEPLVSIMKTIRASPEVRAKLGDPVDAASLTPVGSIQQTGEHSAAGRIRFSVKGPKDWASVYVECNMLNNVWTHRRLDVRTRDGKTIYLGEQKGPAPGSIDALAAEEAASGEATSSPPPAGTGNPTPVGTAAP